MESHQQWREKLRDKIQGVIFGAAIGDGVGLATEFMNKDKAKCLYGYGPIKFGKANGHEFYRDGHRCRWHENDFTDDTDQMLLILQCLLSSNGHLIPEQFAFRLKEWTEIGFPELSNKACCGVGVTVGSVIGHSEFVKNPHKAAFDVWESNGCNLAANGAVMRTSVLGIPLFYDESQVVQNAINCAKVTHVDPRCIFSSVVVSVLISRMLRMEFGIGEKYDIYSNREKLMKLAGSKTTNTNSKSNCNEDFASEGVLIPKKKAEDKPQNFFQSIRKFVNKSDQNIPFSLPNHKVADTSRLQRPVKCSNDSNKFPSLYGENAALMALIGEVVSDYKFLIHANNENSNWNADIERFCPPKHLHELKLDERSSIGYTLKCLGSAVFCFSRQKNDDIEDADFFMRVITELTLEAGDADTNAAVAGALLGCRLGFKGLPKVWSMELRHRQFLMKISDELLELVMNQLSVQPKDVTQKVMP